MAIYVDNLSAPTAGGGIRTFIDTESWELITTGVDDFHRPIAERDLLTNVLAAWLDHPNDLAYNGTELAHLILGQVSQGSIPADLQALLKKTVQGRH